MVRWRIPSARVLSLIIRPKRVGRCWLLCLV